MNDEDYVVAAAASPAATLVPVPELATATPATTTTMR